MATSKRMGQKDSATWHALLDAAERVLRESGAGAATSRRIAEEAGVTQQLVYYYFTTIDEVLLATFKRRSETALAKAKEVTAPDASSDIWRDFGSSIALITRHRISRAGDSVSRPGDCRLSDQTRRRGRAARLDQAIIVCSRLVSVAGALLARPVADA